MSLLFTPLTRAASDSMNRARGLMAGASPDNEDVETADYNTGGHDVDDNDEDAITQNMKQLRMQMRGASPRSLSRN